MGELLGYWRKTECDDVCFGQGYKLCRWKARRDGEDDGQCYGFREQTPGDCGLEEDSSSEYLVWDTCLGTGSIHYLCVMCSSGDLRDCLVYFGSK